jgi:hypothetical protein
VNPYSTSTYEVAERGGPGGEDNPDEDEPLPKGQLHHVKTVLKKKKSHKLA